MVIAPGAAAAVSPDAPVVINEVYGGGGNSGAVFSHDFIELRNTSSTPQSVDGWSVQYASSAGTNWSGRINLSGTIPAGGLYLVQGGTNNASVGAPLPTPNASGNVNLAGANGNVALTSSTAALSCQAAACAADAAVVDLVGFGTGAAFAGTGAAPAPSNSTSVARDAAGTNTADNAADFTVGAPTPSAGSTTPVDPPTPEPGETLTIAQVRALTSGTVTTRGVVTAAYPTGGYNGYVIQTPGTGAENDGRTVSDAIFVFSSATVGSVAVGDYVEVTGTRGEFNGLSQIQVTAASGLTQLTEEVPAPVPAAIALPAAADREPFESMLIAPQGDFTVSNTYSTNQYGEVGLASGTTPLIQPTQVARPGTPEAAAVAADNADRGVILDDGASTNFFNNRQQTPPYISTTDPVIIGAAVEFTDPVILDWRNNAWKLSPTSQVTPADASAYPATFENTRTQAPDAEAIGDADLTVGAFNVLNYFTTLGFNTPGCTSYDDRDGNPVTVRGGCDPRGAWGQADLDRQQSKIVDAINATDASVLGLMEIENSAKLGKPADAATATLVNALNAQAGTTKWDYVRSNSAELPPLSQQDVITNAIIFQPAEVELDGALRVLGNQSASGSAYQNAREPLGQSFVPVGGTDEESVFVVVNHFKSKGSAGPLQGDADAGDGQGASNASRVAQATALREWLPTVTEEGDAVALVGDFNSYGMEDPLEVFVQAGFTDAATEFGAGYSYSFQGLSGSLDHVFLNEAAMERATGADIWNINSGESIALEYSRYLNHGTDFYAPGPYRSSDHDPVIAGLSVEPVVPAEPVGLSLLNINDFHGRIDNNTVNFAGTVEQQRAAIDAEGGSSLFLSAGDNIGASLFASAVAQDQPTIDVLNALELASSAVGNHEFDQGYDDLVDRVIDGGENATFPILGANVRLADGSPALQEYSLHEVDGLTVAVIGAVTEETPTLVSPAGIADLTFTDPVEAVNRVAEQLTDGNLDNDEADVIIAEYHEGAGAGIPDGSTLEEEVADGGAFADIVNLTDPAVDVIFTGHTHKQYAWDGPVPGADGETRPILQTGSYGEFLGRVDLTVDPATGDVTEYTAENVARSTTPAADLVRDYPRVAAVKTIVDAALAEAQVIGSQPIGSVTADITTAYSGGSYVDGVYQGSGPLPSTGRDNRAAESTLSNLVANSLVSSLSSPDRGAATIGVVNPGGLRNELFFDADGVITYAEANAVLPFVNNLWTTSLSGEQFKVLLEQQWQTNADGTIPSRPYLQLGLSDNVTYTFDATRPMGDRITSVTVDGEPLDPAASYRIGTFSFLATGGDNFRVFTQGTDTRDSGLVDREAWISYLGDASPVTPSFARRAVQVPEVAPVAAGGQLSVALGQLDLTSLGSPRNTTATATLGDVELGEFAVTEGATTIAAQVPATVAAGDYDLVVTVAPSGTEVTVPVTVTADLTVPFTDVPEDNQFFNEIRWAFQNGITTGWTEADGSKTYRPLANINRDAMAAFLYRLAKPVGYTAPTVSPFVDVPTSNQFYTEIAWLHEQGISTGWATPAGAEFRPLEPINRDAMAAFIYRYAKQPAFDAPTVSPFDDVDPSNQFYKEITWMHAQGIATGWPEGNDGRAVYRPVAPIARDAMAAFLFRYSNLQD
ncbi:ExeM/NucH family extracellular endonuclease [Litorihabitans aurantiacus]|uniref:Multifunctional nuclease/2',3'-cyclic-nucleotide 2'-phosphodiesterase/5'-nucleotidase/3'-nucleotidase n=1 Tax=Litorihabitans aurantiacus TaxID=1930061 RepID=A0AA37XHU1_9MICO|nr:multifunctional nuclease/2',3'-cyclic-nucleotide 2'-phosphodiesterase/5'-nucleotidase/3'-nucleotidase [Litorihabitans aurantiacus]